MELERLCIYAFNQPSMFYKLSFALLLFASIHCSGRKESKTKPAPAADAPAELQRAHTYASQLLAYAQQKNYATDYAFLIDMKAHSGSKRFYVYRFDKKQILYKGLVTHGNCGETFLTGRRYGNTVGCNCSSLGKYKIGNKYYGRFGLAYKLYGLDTSNSNAFERYVVLHAHSCVPDEEVKPFPICQSNGCPTVSPAFLKTLETYIDKSRKPVLMWIFE